LSELTAGWSCVMVESNGELSWSRILRC